MPQAQFELNIRDYVRIFRKRKFIIVLSIIIFTALGIWYSSKQIPVYQTSTTVKIEERRTIAGLLTDWVTYNPADTLESQAKIIKGYPILKKVALDLQLIDEATPEAQTHQIVQKINAKVITERLGNTNILKITATSEDPAEAMIVANTVAKVYVEENLLEKNKQARTVREFIETQLQALSERMKLDEEKLQVFSEQIQNIKVAEPIQNKLTELEFELASLLQRYTEKHPKTIQLREQIASLQGQIEGLSGEDLEYARLQRETEVDRKLYAMLKERLEQARITEAEEVADVSVVDPAVMPGAPINAQGNLPALLGILMGFIVGGILAFILEMSDTSIGTVEEVEAVTGLPMLGVIPSVHYEIKGKGGFFGGLRNVFLPRRTTETDDNFIRLLVHHKPTSPIAEAFRNIRTNLKISPSRKTFLVTSANPKEGKTSIVTNLGLAIAQENQKTLLISSDLRRPQISNTFGISKEPGLAELLQGAATLDETIQNITDIMLGEFEVSDALSASGLRNISILPSGAYPPNAAELIASKEFPAILAKLHGEYDCILLDSPPVLPVTDAAILAPLVDGVILCYEIGRTSKSALLRTKTQLESVGAKILGLVLNHTKPETEPLEPYPYYYRYRERYYREEPAQKKSDTA